MKTFIIKIILLFAFVAVIDGLIGFAGSKMSASIHEGVYGRDNYIANETNEDILIFGSSRAVHHYNAPMLSDSLGLTCYNCGDDGCGIILSYGRLLMSLESHQPKIAIQDINPSYDVHISDNRQFIGFLKTHYKHPGITEMIQSIDPLENIKMKSNLYRFNSKLHHMFFVYLTKLSNDTGIQGFRPSAGTMDTMKISKHRGEPSLSVDTVKMRFINQFINAAGSAKVFFVVSPIWYGMDQRELQPVKDICIKRGVLFIDFSNDPKYVHQDKYFKDGTHLNSQGADEFTKDLIKVFRTL